MDANHIPQNIDPNIFVVINKNFKKVNSTDVAELLIDFLSVVNELESLNLNLSTEHKASLLSEMSRNFNVDKKDCFEIFTKLIT